MTSDPLALGVLYADDSLAIVNKPAGLMVHDSELARGETDFAVDRLREQFARPIFLVHRLDRATSGCLLVAFDRGAASALGKALMTGGVRKDYWAICRGWPREAQFTVDHAIDGGPGRPQIKASQTEFELLARCELPVASAGFPTSRYAWLCASPLTGRYRQIRRHLKHVSHPLIGDTCFGDGHHNRTCRAMGITRMLLHARRLALVHPVSGAPLDVSAPVDDAFARALALFATER